MSFYTSKLNCLSISLIYVLLQTTACTSSSDRAPAADQNGREFLQEMSTYYHGKLEEQLIKQNLNKEASNYQRQGGTSGISQDSYLASVDRYNALLANNTNLKNQIERQLNQYPINYSNSELEPGFLFNGAKFLQGVDRFGIPSLEKFKKNGGQITRFYALDGDLYEDYAVEIENLLPPVQGTDKEESRRLKTRMHCDAEFQVKNTLFSKPKSVTEQEFLLYGRPSKAKTFIALSKGVTSCQLEFKEFDDRSEGYPYGINLKTTSSVYPFAAKLKKTVHPCLLPKFEQNNPALFYLSANFDHLTCNVKLDSYDYIYSSQTAFRKKFNILMGQTITPEEVQNLSFKEKIAEKLPKFDMIIISSLFFRNDYFGNTLANILKYHADRGTMIRILVPVPTTLEKDFLMLNELEAYSSNVKILYYKFATNDFSDGNVLDKLHRVNHTKIMLTYSATDPSLNNLITGGRNIRDAWIFEEAPDFKDYPGFVQYKEGEEPYLHYKDTEIFIKSTPYVEQVASQMLSLFNIREDDMRARSTGVTFNIPRNEADAADFIKSLDTETYARHIVSVPFADEKNLENFYIGMIGSAKKSIEISTPYFFPTDRIKLALEAASKNGVKITILTRMDLSNDVTILKSSAETANNKAINWALANNIDVYIWADPKSLVHAKLMLLDNMVTFIGTANLNGRSFIHDLESGTLIASKTLANKVSETFGYYKSGKDSYKVTKPVPVKKLDGLLLKIFHDYF